MSVSKASASVFVCEAMRVLGRVEEYRFGSTQTHISESCTVRVEIALDLVHKLCIVCGQTQLPAQEKLLGLIYNCGCTYICGASCTRPLSCTEGREGAEVRAEGRARD